MSYYYPERLYHQLNAVAYPDHSRSLPGMDGVIRAFWKSGEHMWDEDFNNNMEWIAQWWANSYAYTRWSKPRYPWYSPYLSIYIVETDHNVTPDPPNNHAIFWQYERFPFPQFPLKPWAGVTTVVLADRQYIGFRKNPGSDDDAGGWRGITQFQEYVDEIEISFFFSETRKDRILGAHTVVEPFRLHQQSYSSRVRGWPPAGANTGSLLILKNGVQVGVAWKSEYSSGINLTETTEFAAGDVLAIKQNNDGSVRYGVTVSIVGELL